MAKSSTTITKDTRQEMPSRGRSNRTIILEVIREESMINLNKDSTRDEAEKAFFGHVAKRAFNSEDQNSGMCLKLLSDKGWANLKPANENVNFDFDDNLKPHQQAAQVMLAASKGEIPPDIANTFIQSIKSMIDIEEYTDLKERIEKLEKALAGEP